MEDPSLFQWKSRTSLFANFTILILLGLFTYTDVIKFNTVDSQYSYKDESIDSFEIKPEEHLAGAGVRMHIIEDTWERIRQEIGEGATNQQVAQRFCEEYIYINLNIARYTDTGVHPYTPFDPNNCEFMRDEEDFSKEINLFLIKISNFVPVQEGYFNRHEGFGMDLIMSESFTINKESGGD